MVLFPVMLLLATASQHQQVNANNNTKPSLNVMLMEADLLTPEACEQVRRASMFPTSVKYIGYWFCFESILGRFVDSTTIKYTQDAHLVHYPLKPRDFCSRDSFRNVKDVYIFSKHPKDRKLKIIEHTEDEAYNSEFVQKSITAVELMSDMMCAKINPRLKSEFLVQLDGLANSVENVFLLTTSNLPWDLDPAILRRLEKKIFVDVPDDAARTALFEEFLPENVNEYLKTVVDHRQLANNSDGYSGAEIKLVCKEALMVATRAIIRELDNRGFVRKIAENPIIVRVTTDDVLEVLARVKPVCSDSKRFKSWLSDPV